MTGTSQKQAAALVAVATAQDTLYATPEHPFYLPQLKKYVPASELRPSNRLQLSNGTCAAITSTRWLDTLVTVYNISVAEHHNYFAEGVLVHNADCDTKARAEELQASLDIFFLAKVAAVVAVGIAKKSNGNDVYLISLNNGTRYKTSQTSKVSAINQIKAQLKGNETFVDYFLSNPDDAHAEDNMIAYAKSVGLILYHIDASAGICLDCENLLKQNNISTSTHFTGQKSKKRK